MAYASGLTAIWTTIFSLRPSSLLTLPAVLPGITVMSAWLLVWHVHAARWPFMACTIAMAAIAAPVAIWTSFLNVITFMVHPTQAGLESIGLVVCVWLLIGYHTLGLAAFSEKPYQLPMDAASARGSANV